MLTFDTFEIQPIKETDAWKVCNFCVSNEDRLKTYFPKTLEQNITPTLSELFVSNMVKANDNKTTFLYTIKEIETRNLVGLFYIKELDWTIKQGEFAYAIDYNFKGKQIMTKAVKILTDLAFEELGLKKLQIIVYKENKASINVALNNSFVWQRTLTKEFIPPNSAPLDMELYEKYKN